MTEKKLDQHIEVEQLAEFAAGQVVGAKRESVRRHLDECALCQLELRRLERFATIDSDEELLAEADWSRAQFELSRGLQETILPEIAKQSRQSQQSRTDRTRARFRGSVRWLVPAAAMAAALIFLLMPRESGHGPQLPGQGYDPLRNGGTVAQPIVLESPAGELATWPKLFRWRSETSFDSYTLEIFTPDLKMVFRQEQIRQVTYAATDSLQALLAPDQTYLWSVQGFTGLEASAVSANNWFKILTDPEKRPEANSGDEKSIED